MGSLKPIPLREAQLQDSKFVRYAADSVPQVFVAKVQAEAKVLKFELGKKLLPVKLDSIEHHGSFMKNIVIQCYLVFKTVPLRTVAYLCARAAPDHARKHCCRFGSQ